MIKNIHKWTTRNHDSPSPFKCPFFCRRIWIVGTITSLFWILLELRMTEVVVTTGAIGCAKLQPYCHHQQTNTQLYTGRMPFLLHNQQCQSTQAHTNSVLTVIFPGEPGLAGCSLNSPSPFIPELPIFLGEA